MFDNNGNIKVLKSVDCEKDLGVCLQDNLKFDKHISLTVNRANRLNIIKTLEEFHLYLTCW